jgi:hypothetical protein
MPRLLRHLPIRVFVVALLFLCGAQWFVLQSVAWTSMLITSSQHTSLLEAVKETFDGGHPCALCCKVEGARGHEKEDKAQPVSGKLVLFHQDVESLAAPAIRLCKNDFAAVNYFVLPRCERPPHQPPRAV